MTYKERMQDICNGCDQSEVCGYYLTDNRRGCEYLNDIEYGWKLGQKDTLEAVESYVDRGNSTFTEEFMAGLKQLVFNN